MEPKSHLTVRSARKSELKDGIRTTEERTARANKLLKMPNPKSKKAPTRQTRTGMMKGTITRIAVHRVHGINAGMNPATKKARVTNNKRRIR